jgi:hypothetical protein
MIGGINALCLIVSRDYYWFTDTPMVVIAYYLPSVFLWILAYAGMTTI